MDEEERSSRLIRIGTRNRERKIVSLRPTYINDKNRCSELRKSKMVEEQILKLKRSARERGRVSFYPRAPRVEEPLETIQTIQLVRDTAIHRDANRGNITTVKRIGVTNRK